MMLGLVLIAAAARPRRTAHGQFGPVASFTLTSASGGSNLPFSIGHAFKQGDVLNASALGADTAVQVDVKNSWPDGSLKFAVISGRKTLSAATPATVTLSNGGARNANSALTTTDLKATGITASIAYGAFGTVSWATTDWDSPFQTLASGPELSSWTYRKAIGADAHLVVWLEVRLYAGGSVEVLPWIENGYLNVASPTSKTGTATFTLGGSSRYSASLTLLNHTRSILASGTTLTHWLGTDPGVTPKHDTAYLMGTKLVPNYLGNTVSATSLYSRLPTSYTPLAQGSYRTTMSDPGYDPSIGLLPEWDVAYLTCAGDARAYTGVLIQAMLAGRFGIHYRDETTNRPLSFASYPNLGMGSGSNVLNIGSSSSSTPSASGTAPPEYDNAHHPSMGFMAYLLTGRNYFLEELQLVATANFLKYGSSGRNNSQGVFESSSSAGIVRGAAWSLRTLAQAAAMTPDGDALRTQFVNSIDSNISYYHAKYVGQSNNPLGLVHPYDQYGTPGGIWESSSWMDDFFTATFGYLKDLAVNSSGTSQTKLDAFLAYKYVAVVGRLGGSSSSEYSYRHAGQYTVYFAPSDSANYSNGTGPWYSDWGAAARAAGVAQDGTAGASIVDGNPTLATSYLANLLPAICYAVDHGASGAAAAYARLSGAGNWSTHVATYNSDPVWGVAPRT